MNSFNKTFAGVGLAAAAMVLWSAPSHGQSLEISSGQGQPGSTVTIEWSFTQGAVDVAGKEWCLDWDPAIVSLTDDANCVANVPAGFDGAFTSCTVGPASCPNGLNVAVVANDFDTVMPDMLPGGSVEFTIDAGATAGSDSSALTGTCIDVQPPTSGGTAGCGDLTITDGNIDVVSGPQSELTLTPNPMAFGTVDLGNMPATDTFTLENVGAADANISSVSLGGPDAEFTIAADNCTGTLAAGATCTVDIEFNAGANGSYSNQLDVASDANVNPNPSANITGSASSVASLSVNPAFGPVNLGQGLPGSTLTANGSISNSGSADGDFTCTLTGDPEISTTPSPLSGTVPAGGSADFSISCALPTSGVEGDSYSATLECSGDNGFGGTHEISCGVTEREPLAVPTMSKIGLGVLALLMVMIGGLTVRFFRA